MTYKEIINEIKEIKSKLYRETDVGKAKTLQAELKKVKSKVTYELITNELEQYELPTALNGQHLYYFNLPETVKIYRTKIEDTIAKGINPNKVEQCKIYKRHLIMILEDLEDRTQWNAPRAGIQQFYNKNEM